MHVEAVWTFHGSLQLSSPSKCEVEGGNGWTDKFYSFSQWNLWECVLSELPWWCGSGVYVVPHQARHWNILTATVKEMDTNWVKTGFISFLLIFNHMVPSKGHHHVPRLHLSPCWDLYISSQPPPTSYSPWRCWLQCTLTRWNTFNIQHS